MDSELIELVYSEIPEAKPMELGFLDVVGQQHNENAISNCYAYFIEQSPVIGNKLIYSLQSLITSKYQRIGVAKELELNSVEVTREFPTKSRKGRIDLVIDSPSSATTVIIEAKVYHQLLNDLDDYWDTFPDRENRKKAGIVLSLNPLLVGDTRYINITHKEWLDETLKGGIPTGLPVKDYIYFTDFVTNIQRLTNEKEMTEEVSFYLQHVSAIEKAIKTKQAAEKYVMDQIQRIAGHYGFSAEGNKLNWQTIWDKEVGSTVYYTMRPCEILEGKGTITILLEIGDEAMKNRKECLDLMDKKFVDDKFKTLGTYGEANCQQILATQFTLRPQEFGQLAERSIEAIENHLKPAYDAVYKLLKKNSLHQHIS